MDKKTQLLSTLKKQVIALKVQLEGLEKSKSHKISRQTNNMHAHSSVSHSSRFDSINLDCSYLEKRGRKKFALVDSKFKNIAEVIK